PLTPEFPLSLNSARVRDHWHTMTRTALAPELNRHMSEPLLDIHPRDAVRVGLAEGRLARVTTLYGEAIVKARMTDDVREGSLHLPMHWTRVFAPFGRSNQLINPAVDARSGQPEFKHTPARVEPYGETWHGFVMTPRTVDGEEVPTWDPSLIWGDSVIWRRIRHNFAECYEVAGLQALDGFESVVGHGPVLSLDDARTGVSRRIRIEDGQLRGVAFVAPADKRLPGRDWLLERFGDLILSAADRAALLLGRLPGVEDQGKVVCACRGIGEKNIQKAVDDGATTVEAIGHLTGAGTACGSCKGEIKQCLVAHLAGVTAASAAAAQFSFPLTHRGEARSVTFLTGRTRDGSVDLKDGVVAD
ncbi:MAG: (2Fe-2S)-binding protein, partial [Asticcacaulis sp.]|nr:(2Fe-2S)-binding protein [Asticcacaulis sp.]